MTTSRYFLENENAERYSLNLEDDVTLINVDGLGLNFSQATASLDDGFYLHTKEDVPRGTVTGTLLFRGNAFENYRTLVNWMMAAKTLYFVYCPYGTAEFYAEAKINFLTKSYRVNDWSEMSISFIILSPWYLPTAVALNFADPAEISYFTWNVSALGTAALAPNTSGEYSAEIVADGHCPAAIKIAFNGSILDPAFILKNADTYETIGRCALSGAYTGDLILDTTYGHSALTYNGTDMVQSLDVSSEYEPFFRLPIGVNCLLVIESPQFTGTCTASIKQYYRSV